MMLSCGRTNPYSPICLTPRGGGVTMADEEVAEMMKNLTGTVPEDLAVGEDADPWSITFASERPIRTQLDDSTVVLSMRGKRFTRGSTQLKRTIEMSATYQLEETLEEFKLIRQGDVRAELPGAKRLSASQVATKAFMRKKVRSAVPTRDRSGGYRAARTTGAGWEAEIDRGVLRRSLAGPRIRSRSGRARTCGRRGRPRRRSRATLRMRSKKSISLFTFPPGGSKVRNEPSGRAAANIPARTNTSPPRLGSLRDPFGGRVKPSRTTSEQQEANEPVG